MYRMLMTAAGGSLPAITWDAVSAASQSWAAARRPREGDVPLTFYRDANTWCPFCHRVFFYLEQKGLRYATVRVHLGGDPREPPKAASYLRDVAPRGNVPALRIRDEVVLESLDILKVLDREFPDEMSIKSADELPSKRSSCNLAAPSMSIATSGSSIRTWRRRPSSRRRRAASSHGSRMPSALGPTGRSSSVPMPR